jgi:ADP-L-glycero-D-manno-heptose 6-epimerase
VEFIETPQALKLQYQSFTEARMERLRAAGYAKDFTTLENGIGRYVRDYLSQPNPYR